MVVGALMSYFLCGVRQMCSRTSSAYTTLAITATNGLMREGKKLQRSNTEQHTHILLLNSTKCNTVNYALRVVWVSERAFGLWRSCWYGRSGDLTSSRCKWFVHVSKLHVTAITSNMSCCNKTENGATFRHWLSQVVLESGH